MKCYIYAADVYCEACGKDIRSALKSAKKAPPKPEDENTYDSDDYPKGPFPVEPSDTPQHCGSGVVCLSPTVIEGENYRKFLENSLTEDGVQYVKDQLARANPGPVAKYWGEFYKID